MPNVLLTGGCGFIGSNLVHYLLEVEPDWTIINFDALTYAGNLANLDDLKGHPRDRFIKGEHHINREQVREAMAQGVKAIILHLAAESHVDRSILDSGPFVRTNVLGTQILLDAARQFQVERFLHVSTDEVYGSLGATGFFTEETPLAPNSPYAASKAASDLLVRSYHHTFGLPAVITRCSNIYGPYQFPEKLLPLFITNFLADQSVPVYGDGLQVRDWIHVHDHCAALHRVCKHGQAGEVYNIGGRCEKTNLEMTHTLLKVLGKPTSLIRHIADRLGHDRRYAIDCAKIEKELGWQPPPINFQERIEKDGKMVRREYAAWVENVRFGAHPGSIMKRNTASK